jgi:Mce-associated membrane protein
MTAQPTNKTDDAELAAAQAEDEAAEAEAAATAARARAKAASLRRQALEEEAKRAASPSTEAEAPDLDTAAVYEDEADDAADDDEQDDLEDDGRRFKLVWWWPAVAIPVAILMLCGTLFASGYFIKQHQEAVALRDLKSQFETGARQDVVNLMSLNFNSAQVDLQRVIDSTTGQFHEDFQKSAKDFLSVMKESKVVTTASVSAVAVESMTQDSAVVLVAAVSQVANTASGQPTPRNWRLSVTVNKVNDQIKMSRVEFVP